MYVEMRNIYKQYGNFRASDNVSFGIEKGKLAALLGPSGSGKTTLLRMIAGLENPNAGDIFIDGKRVNDIPAAKRGIGFVFQSYALFRYMTVFDNIAFGLEIAKMPKKQIKERVFELLELTGLSGLENRYPNQLSGGQRQRVAIGRSLLMEPRLIIADEPIASLDISIQAQIVMLLKKLQQEKRFSFLFIAHDLSMVRFLSDTTGVMKNGKLVEMAPTKELFENPQHPYTQSLLSAIHIPDPLEERKRKLIEYEEPQSLGEGWKELSACHCVRI